MRGINVLSLLILSGLIQAAPDARLVHEHEYEQSSFKIGPDNQGWSGGSQGERYDGQSVWRVDWSGLDKLAKDEVRDVIELLNLDIWHASPRSLDVRLSTRELAVLRSYLPSSSFRPFIPDLQTVIDQTILSLSSFDTDTDTDTEDGSPYSSGYGALSTKKKGKGKGKGKKPKIDPFNLTTLATPFHDTYHSLEDLYKFGDTLISTFHGVPIGEGEEGEKIDISSFGVGKTFEGREIRGWSAQIVRTEGGEETSFSEEGRKGRNGRKGGNGKEGAEDDEVKLDLEFIVQSGQHGREWIGPSSSLYFIHSLLLSALGDSSSDAALLLRSFTFTVIPTINPDGLTYSRDHSRLWRKNRQAIGSKSCLGIDLNSNWGYKWRPSRAAPCSEAYPGKAAFEAYESKAVSAYLDSAAQRGTKIRAFVDVHSYGQLFMFPFAHSCQDFPPDAEMLMEAGLGVAKAMRSKNGQGYEAGQACDLTYRAPGDAIDYSYGVTDVRWSYSAELRDTGTYGFLLPPKLIRATAEEASAGLQYLAKFIYTLEVAP